MIEKKSEIRVQLMLSVNANMPAAASLAVVSGVNMFYLSVVVVNITFVDNSLRDYCLLCGGWVFSDYIAQGRLLTQDRLGAWRFRCVFFFLQFLLAGAVIMSANSRSCQRWQEAMPWALHRFLTLLLEFLHVAHKLLMFFEVHLMIFDRDVTVWLKQTTGKLEVLLLNLLNLSLANDQIQALRPEWH